MSRDVALGGFQLASQQPEERRLPGAVAADNAPPIARRDREGDVREERARPEIDARAGNADDG
jgi:hypothetical protein